MILPLLLTAAVVTIPPPAESGAMKPSFVAVAGVGNPDWGHAGVLGRLGDVGAQITLGYVGLGAVGALSGRFWFPLPLRGGYLEAGACLVRVAQLSAHTPDDLTPLGFAAIGWQFHWEKLLLDVAVGPAPTLLTDAPLPPLVALNALDLPRFKLGVGYAF
jgi:hypothetical protein